MTFRSQYREPCNRVKGLSMEPLAERLVDAVGSDLRRGPDVFSTRGFGIPMQGAFSAYDALSSARLEVADIELIAGRHAQREHEKGQERGFEQGLEEGKARARRERDVVISRFGSMLQGTLNLAQRAITHGPGASGQDGAEDRRTRDQLREEAVKQLQEVRGAIDEVVVAADAGRFNVV